MNTFSPKKTRRNSPDSLNWYSYYAGYSSDFVRNALSEMLLPATAHVLDPWNGSGTTTRVANDNGYYSIGYDLNPVMVIVAKSRLLPVTVKNSLASLCSEIIQGAFENTNLHDESAEPLTLWFKPEAALFVRQIEQSTKRLLVDQLHINFQEAKSLNHVSSLAAFFYVAIFRTLRELVKVFCSSNPTWIKEPNSLDDRVSPDTALICLVFKQHVQSMIDTIPNIQCTYHHSEAVLCRLELASSETLPLEEGTIDAVITSPPYCTRIDYCIATKPELALLGYHMKKDLKSLRDKMIGTPTIAKKNIVRRTVWGNTCNQFLEGVEQHTSKASKSYYLKTLLQYFDALYNSLTEIDRVLKTDGNVIIVVQDSYYKDLHNDLPQITSQMASNLGWRVQSHNKFEMQSSMASINPRKRLHRSSSSTIESVVAFKKTT